MSPALQTIMMTIVGFGPLIGLRLAVNSMARQSQSPKRKAEPTSPQLMARATAMVAPSRGPAS
jgi:hypothetical protein